MSRIKMKDPNCIFCKIVAGEVPTHFVYENEFVVAFPDINPLAPGHTLVIPRDHHQWFYDVPGELASEWFRASQSIALELKKSHNADFVELKIVGVDVPHTHLHLIPRKR